MKPLAKALDTLQGDKAMYMGYLLPVLQSLKEKLQNLKERNLVYCAPLITSLEAGLKKRYMISIYLKIRFIKL